MVDIHMVVPMDQQKFARAGIAPKEYDILAVGDDQFLGVIESCDSGFMFTDSFGAMTTFTDGEELREVFRAVDDLFNPTTVN